MSHMLNQFFPEPLKMTSFLPVGNHLKLSTHQAQLLWGPAILGAPQAILLGTVWREGAEKTPSLMGPAREAQPPWIGLGPHRETLRVGVQFGEGSVDT